jgi:putative Holliday junction resolvase
VRDGRRLGVDVGSVRLGVAVSDPGGALAVPLDTVRRGPDDLDRLAALATEHEVLEVVVGLPVSLSGREGQAAHGARDFADQLAPRLGVPVRLVDERLSTVDAHRALREAGMNAKRRRGVVDRSAAVIILQSALDAERSTGRPPGVVVGEDPRPDTGDE